MVQIQHARLLRGVAQFGSERPLRRRKAAGSSPVSPIMDSEKLLEQIQRNVDFVKRNQGTIEGYEVYALPSGVSQVDLLKVILLLLAR